MQFAILGDTHFGARNDSPIFNDYFEKSLADFFSFLEKQNIKVIFQLGDLFDRRKYINFYTLQRCKEYFFDKVEEGGYTLYTLLGNHDIFYRNTLDVNSTGLILGEYTSVNLVDKPTTVTLAGTSVDLIPWVCQENFQEVSEFMAASKSDLCFGHFEIAGFHMYKGSISEEGMDRKTFEKYELVCSGHYHTRSESDNITYVGTPYEITWQDAYDPRGFHIFDTDTRKLKFIENVRIIHHKVEYDESDDMINYINQLSLRDTFVKVLVRNKKDLYKYDIFLQHLKSLCPTDVKIIEDLTDYSNGQIDETIDVEDTLSIMDSYVESLPIENSSELKSYLRTLYVEVINSEEV